VNRARAALAALALCALASCAAQRTRVVLIGDSITAGASSEPHGPGYAELLKDLLGPSFEVVNVACAGSSTLDWQPGARPAQCKEAGADVSMYAERALPALPADVATILLGTNDLVGAYELAPVEPDTYAGALRTLAAALHTDGAREVVLMSPPATLQTLARLMGYRSRIQALCQEEPYLRCGPDLASLLRGSDFAAEDIHPNAQGHAKIAAALAEMLRPAPAAAAETTR
jgi:lysophospholipase L1-like esterase